MDREESVVLQRLVTQWAEVGPSLARMHSAATVRPSAGWAVFELLPGATPNVVEFAIKPVVFNLPERADDVSTDLYIVVQGRIAVRRDTFANEGVLVTHGFSTKAA